MKIAQQISFIVVAALALVAAGDNSSNYPSFPIEPTHTYRLRNGSTIPLPSNFYADAVFVSGLVLKDAAYEHYHFDEYYTPVAGPLPRTLLATLAFFHYKHTDAGSYNELALIFPVNPKTDNQKFDHPYNIPKDPRASEIGYDYAMSQALWLDTKEGVEFGREIWGYPKTLCDIDYEADQDSIHFTLRDKKTRRKIVSLNLNHGPMDQEDLWSTFFGITPVNTDMNSFDAWNGKVNPYIMESGRFANQRWLDVVLDSSLEIADPVLGALNFIPVQFWRGSDVKLAIGYPANFVARSSSHN